MATMFDYGSMNNWGLSPQAMQSLGTYGVGGSPDVPAVAQDLGGGVGNALLNGGGGGGVTTPPSFFDGMLGYNNGNGFQPGWGGMALSALQGVGNAFMGMKQYGLAQATLKEQKRQFNLNYNAQRNAMNSQMYDRQNARVAANPNGYDSTATYMQKYGV